MDRKPDQLFLTYDRKLGAVYRVANPQEVWDMVSRENGYAYQTQDNDRRVLTSVEAVSQDRSNLLGRTGISRR